MNDKTKRNIAVLINMFIFISTLAWSIHGVIYGAGSGQLGEQMRGAGYFKAFTILSNILLGICALTAAVSLLRGRPGAGCMKLYLTGAAAAGLTFAVVLLFLGPMQLTKGKSFFSMYSNDMFFFHLLNPLLAAINLALFMPRFSCTKKDVAAAVIPTALYSFVYIYFVVITKQWSDFYNFTFGGKVWLTPIVATVLYAATYGIAALLARLSGRQKAGDSA